MLHRARASFDFRRPRRAGVLGVGQAVVCGPDADRHAENVRQFVDAGYDEIYVQQIGPDQEGFFRFWSEEVTPKLR